MAVGGAGYGVAKVTGFTGKEVLREVGPESRVKGTGVQGALGTVWATWTCGKRAAGLPLGGGRGGVGVT